MEQDSITVTAFAGDRLLASGPAAEVALALKVAARTSQEALLVFDDRTGRQVDFNLSGSDAQVIARLVPNEAAGAVEPTGHRGVGRPKLGVVAREITLLPRHWQWLAEQPGGASVTLRKLVDVARSTDAGKGTARVAQQAADRFMTAVLGNRPGYEDAARALYAGDRQRFHALSQAWPADLRTHARRLAEPAFAVQTKPT